jgi:outer membrane receptor protein involved in Fe transport
MHIKIPTSLGRNLAFAAFGLSAAYAQPTRADSAEDAVSTNSPALAEVVVTANKREQNLNDVGLSVTALSGAALENQRITDVASLAQFVPGLEAAPTRTTAPIYTIRGVGFFEQSLAAYPDVSLYLDQAPLPFPILAAKVLFDVERLEVLKGPQGTLFGNNSTGGAINFIAAKPTASFDAGIEAGYSRFNTFETEGFVSGPIADTLRARLAFKSVQGDGWQYSYTREGGPQPAAYIADGVPPNLSGKQDTLGAPRNVAARGLLEWTPNDRLTLNLNINGSINQDEPQAPQFTQSAQANPNGTTGAGGTVTADMPIIVYPVSPKNNRAADWSTDYRPYQDNKFYQAVIRADWKVTGETTFTSISSYDSLNLLNATEGDGTALNAEDIGKGVGTIQTFTEEARLSGPSANRFRWVAGVYYEHSKVDETDDYYIADTTAARFAGYGANGFYSYQTMRNIAGFGNLEFDATDELTFKVGARQTSADRSSQNSTFELVGDPGRVAPVLTLTQFLNAVYQAVFGPQTPTIIPGNSISFNPACGCAETFHGKLNENNTSWSAGVDFKPMKDLLLYANVSKGYKAGSFATVAAAAFEGYDPVKQESILDYEGGFKTTLASGTVSLDGAIFYYSYDDKQTLSKFVDPVFGLLDKLVNVPKSNVKGAELSISGTPLKGLLLSFSGTYLDAKITNYDGVIGIQTESNGLRGPLTASFSGVPLPYSPKWQYSLRADYTFPITTQFDGFLGASVNGQSSSIGILTVDPAQKDLYKLDSRNLLNLNAGVQTNDGHWRAQVWGTNVTNKYYRTTTNLSNDTVFSYTGMPAMFGVNVSYRFK